MDLLVQSMFQMYLGNIYFDSSGKPTNGSTTGCHLHLGFRIDNEYKNPLDYF